MATENYRWLAGVIAAHPDRRVVGRTRLQKTIKLLQRIGLPASFSYTTHFYGPYSEGVQADVGLLENLGLVSENEQLARDGSPYYIMTAKPSVMLSEIEPFQEPIDRMAQVDTVVLELAATYDAYREKNRTHEEALASLRRKKGSKCGEGREAAALELLGQLGLSNK